MASYGNEIERWNLKQAGRIAELLEPVASPDYRNRLLPLKSISSIDHLLDSAYSSFSGGSNIPEYHSPSYYNENCCLPLEQLPYMDSEYVKGIYNPNAINSDPKPTHQHKSLELSSHHNSDNIGLSGQYRSTPTHGTLYQSPSPLTLPPHPPSPPARLHSYNPTRNFENTRGKSNSGNHFDYSVQLATCAQDISNVLLPSDSGTNWISRSKNEGLMTEESEERGPSQDGTKQNKHHVFIRPSSIIFQEYLKSDSLAKTPNLFCTQNSVQAYKIPAEMNSKSSHPLHTNLTAVNDIQENKQYLFACGVPKPPFREADLQSRVSESSQQEGQFPCIQCPGWTEEYSNLDQDVLESSAGLKYMDCPLPSEHVSEKLNSSEDKNRCFGSKEENRNDVWELLLNQHIKMQKLPLSDCLDGVETKPIHHGELDFGNKQFSDSADQTSYYRPNDDSPSQFLNGLQRETQANNNGPDLSMNPKEEDFLNPVHHRKHQLQFQKKLERKPQDDSASEKINRQTTPLLYYLSGGKNTNILSHKNHTQQDEDSGSLPKTSPRSNRPVSAQPIEIQKEINQLQKSKHHLQCTGDDTINETSDVILGSSASSVDESFKNDYREKLKVAQRKVLRETSFKRKDLQMSLPIRLKQKPSKRPSIEHLRSLSLSSANEDAKLIPPPKSLENSSKDEETKKSQAARIGGRKRITEEQKKLCYSEPEKLNKLEDQQDQGVSWREESTGVKSDEINEQEAMAGRRKILENRGSVLASPSLSKTELKQIQHIALIEYMERKIAQRPTSTLHKPPLQKRPSNAKRLPEGKTSNPDISRKTQKNEIICQFLSPERIPEPSPALIATGIRTNRHSASSSATETVHSKPKSAVRETDGNCTGKCASAENLQSGASVSSKDRERSKSSPSPAQDLHRCTTFPASSVQGCENYPIIPSFPSKNEVDLAEEKDCVRDEKQRVCTARGRGKSMEEIGISETVRLSLLSQSTDQLHHVKSLHILPVPGLERGKNSSAANHQSELHSTKSVSGNLPRQTNTEDTVGLERSDTMFQTLERLPSTTKPYGISLSTENLPPWCVSSLGTLQTPLLHSESPLHSPLALSSVEEDNVFFNDSVTNGLEITSKPSCLYDQSDTLVSRTDMTESLPTALSLQVALEGKQSKAEQKARLQIPEKDESSLGGRNEEKKASSAVVNSCCPDVKELTPEIPILFPRRGGNEETQVEKECRVKSLPGNASKGSSRQQPEANDIALSQEKINCHTASSAQSEQGDKLHISSLNEKAAHNSQNRVLPEKETDFTKRRQKSPEDQRYEELAMEIIAKDNSLADILIPHPTRKTALDLLEGLFPVNISVSDRSHRKKGARMREEMQPVLENDSKKSIDGPTEPCAEAEHSAGQSTEDPSSNMNQTLIKNGDGSNDLDDITSKKKELISSIQSKLQTLWGERKLVLSEIKEYALCGKELEAMVQDVCKPNEYERYLMFIGDLEKVVSLLLCLSSRLARVQNAMRKINENTDAEEKQSLNERHNLLSRQREDAKDLKENLDRRERVVSGILSKYLTDKQLQDYKHFVQVKTSLLIEQKDLEEQIKFLEEQLESLEKSILL
ncbi:protein Shroom1 isoform X1 [Gopherus evgoodei]|uniref:protein Shroom1 isoform X1 n=1 Tax=Gopherus evgoodei TaxID=1825980 RepID=UPI0011CF9145|nr:protein Shroom1 isoform X1 [Gopherus evgoodei]XP_030429442.1 protein Shroom1 isoform X1 [Gopherus evgoodei]XP_030429443.1 protein Shroom1 isoform X1 [Gopherus evgoodei]